MHFILEVRCAALGFLAQIFVAHCSFIRCFLVLFASLLSVFVCSVVCMLVRVCVCACFNLFDLSQTAEFLGYTPPTAALAG